MVQLRSLRKLRLFQELEKSQESRKHNGRSLLGRVGADIKRLIHWLL